MTQFTNILTIIVATISSIVAMFFIFKLQPLFMELDIREKLFYLITMTILLCYTILAVVVIAVHLNNI